MPSIDELTGLWRRSMIALPDGSCDTTTDVRWLQGQRMFIDLRQPAPMRDFSGVGCLDDLSMSDLEWLATQGGFAGELAGAGAYVEWQRRIDFQPVSATADAGSLEWAGDTLVERGRDVSYVEHWHRDEGLSTAPCAALRLREAGSQTIALALRVGGEFMFARDRAVPLPAHRRLADCLAAAADLREARALIDCEISSGKVCADGFRITASTLPHRRCARLELRVERDSVWLSDCDAAGAARTRVWDIVECEGDMVNAFRIGVT
jgi:hypothetical protein